MGAERDPERRAEIGDSEFRLDDRYSAIAREIRFRPRRRFGQSGKYFLVASDGLAMAVALIAGRLLKWLMEGIHRHNAFDFWGQNGDIRAILFGSLIFATLSTFIALGHYSQRRPFWDEMRDIWRILLTVAILDAALVFLGKWPFSRLWFLDTWLLALLLVPLFRAGTKRILKGFGAWDLPTAIVGIGPNAVDAAAALRSEPMMGYDVVAFLVPGQIVPPGKETVELAGKSIPVLPLNGAPFAAIKELGEPHLVIAFEANGINQNHRLIAALHREFKDIHIAPAMRGLPLYGLEPLHFFSHEVLLLRTRNNLLRRGPRLAKRVFDVLGASLLLLVLVPLFAVIAIRIWREDGHSIFFVQERVGRGGEVFRVWKFRSMMCDAHDTLLGWLEERPEVREEYENNNFKLRNDPRVTRTGKWLRNTSLDELPQLWNVLKGEMSLVGPRPLLARELFHYGDTIDLYNEARPGITGLWQISGRSDTSFLDRANLDAWYVKNWSLWYDIVILLRTAKVVFRRDGAY